MNYLFDSNYLQGEFTKKMKADVWIEFTWGIYTNTTNNIE